MIWLMMRQAALQRHWMVNQMMGGSPVTWQWHLAMVRMVYGF